MVAGIGISLKFDKRELAQVDRALRLVGEKVYDKVIGQSANAAMKLMVRAARRHVPVRYGLLKKSLGTRLKRYRRNRVAFVAMGPRAGFKRHMTYAMGGPMANPVNYAHLVEFGTRAHSITGGARLGRIGSRAVRATRGLDKGPVVHPGARPQPFMRPAYDETRHEVLRVFSRRVLAGLEKEVRKLARRS